MIGPKMNQPFGERPQSDHRALGARQHLRVIMRHIGFAKRIERRLDIGIRPPPG
jgi:hypothetical protein